MQDFRNNNDIHSIFWRFMNLSVGLHLFTTFCFTLDLEHLWYFLKNFQSLQTHMFMLFASKALVNSLIPYLKLLISNCLSQNLSQTTKFRIIHLHCLIASRLFQVAYLKSHISNDLSLNDLSSMTSQMSDIHNLVSSRSSQVAYLKWLISNDPTPLFQGAYLTFFVSVAYLKSHIPSHLCHMVYFKWLTSNDFSSMTYL